MVAFLRNSLAVLQVRYRAEEARIREYPAKLNHLRQTCKTNDQQCLCEQLQLERAIAWHKLLEAVIEAKTKDMDDTNGRVIMNNTDGPMSNQSLQATRDGRSSSAVAENIISPACLSSGR
jgi:hypothetical protein